MNTFASALVALATYSTCALYAAPTYAQAPATMPSATPSATTSSATTPAATTEMTRDGKPQAKAVREACRAEASGKGLEGLDKRKAISACVVKQRSDLAAREQCRMDGREKGLTTDGLKAYVKDCAKAKG